jgi:hypothetical protein
MDFKSAAPLAGRLFLAIITALSFPLSAVAGTDLPVYPAAHNEPLPAGVHSGTTACGRTITVEKSFTVDADPHTIAKWYLTRLPGSRVIDLSRVQNDEAGGDSQKTTLELFTADGSQTIVIDRMHFSSAKLASASKLIGLDKTQIGVEGISPPFDPGYVALAGQMAAGGASAKKANEQMKAACKG